MEKVRPLFESYAFVQGHAEAMATLVWKQLYLAANHPEEFWTSLLMDPERSYPVQTYINKARRCGVHFHLPQFGRMSEHTQYSRWQSNTWVKFD